MNILFVGGGSVGHIAPSVAVWEALCDHDDDHIVQAHFICSSRPDDAAFLKENNLPYTIFDAPLLSGLYPLHLIGALRTVRKILDEHNPDIIFSKGGYVSLPLCYEAKKRDIPIILHESDSVMGYANRIVARWAAHICTGFPNEQTNKRINELTHTGNPFRKAITQGSKEEALTITGFHGRKPILLVMGGSQGAQAINEIIISQLDDLLLHYDIIHITGRGKSSVMSHQSSVTDDRLPITDHYYSTEFATSDLPHFYAAADLAMSRAGAGSIVELSANRIPSILIPLKGVGHNHQVRNAEVAEKGGGFLHVDQDDLAAQLLATLDTMRAHPAPRLSAAMPDPALQIAKIILKTLDSQETPE